MDRPIFLIGTMRSGSTLLRLVLDSHPAIAIGPESGFMGAVAATKRIPGWRYGDRWYERFGWTEAEFDEHLGRFYGAVFERHAARSGKRRWGEKTPFHVRHVPAMAAMFPDAVFVAIVRHPGAVAASLHGRWHYDFAESVAEWVAANRAVLDAAPALGDGRVRMCRYEDLVNRPEPVLRELMAFLDEPWSGHLLDHATVQREQGAPRVVDGGTRSRQPIDASAATRWLASATPAQLATVERVAGELAAAFGYAPAEAVPAPLPGGGELLTASDLAAIGRAVPPRADVASGAPADDLSEEELRERLAQTEAALRRLERRRAVRYVDAVRRAQRAGSWRDVRGAWRELRGGY